jgi:hypothetical protein
MKAYIGRFRSVTKKADRPLCGARCRDGHTCRARATWDYLNDEPRNGRCRMHGGRSTGPKRKRDGRPATVRKPLDWCKPGAAKIQENDFLCEVQQLVKAAKLHTRLAGFHN